jgi:hypothetical protein
VVVQENLEHLVRQGLAEGHHLPRLGAAVVTDVATRWLEAGGVVITLIPRGLLALDTADGIVEFPPRLPPRNLAGAPAAHHALEAGGVTSHLYVYQRL